MSKIAEALQKSDRESIWWNGSPRGAITVERPPRGGQVLQMPPPRDPVPAQTDWLQAFEALRKHWRLSAIFAAAVMVAVILVTVLTKPLYSPTARVEIDPPGAEMFSLESGGGSDSSADYLETQARNMRSDQLLISVMRQLQLDKNPEFTSRGFVSRSISTVLSGIEHIPSLLWRKGESAQTPAPAQAPNAIALSSAESSTLSTLQGDLSVLRDTASRLVMVTFTSHDPVLSATVTNALVRSFIDRTYQTRHAAIMESTEWLARQLDDIRAKMEESNRALAQFQQSSGIADVDENRSTITEQMAELSRQKTQAQTERIQIQSYLRRAQSQDTASLPQIQSNQVVQLLTQRLGEARAELSQALAIYGKNHPNVKRLQNQADELESQIQLQRKAILAQMETSYSAAMAREQMIDNQLRGTARELGQMGRYAALKKEAQANSELYNSLYARVKESGIAAASKSINIRIVDEARILDAPSRPRPLMNFGIGLFVALVGGVLLAFVREALDTRVCTLDDVRRSMGISAVSLVPIAEGDNRGSLLTSVLTGSPRGTLDGPARFLLDQPGSEQSEAFRGIHTSVMLSQPGNPPRMVLVASSLPGEGKTTVAINLAIALAQQGRTCILDADLRRPSVGRAFHLGDRAGLGEYLLDAAPLDSVLSSVPDVKLLTVLTGGKQIPDPGKVIASEPFKALLNTLRQLYDFVVVDSPPILPYADGRALAPFVDGVIFVGRAGTVTREAMARSLELLQEVHSAPVLEVVLNGAGTDSQGYGYRYSYYKNNS